MTPTTTPTRHADHAAISRQGPPSDLMARMAEDGYEHVVFCHDRMTGLRSIIVVHDTTLGPALGGVRMRPYRSETEALDDCLRLARGMTYKSALAGLDLGGGKSVILGDPDRDKTEGLLRAHGRFIQSLGGRYIPALDLGTSQDDIRILGLECDQIAGMMADPSEYTALGVFAAINECVERRLGQVDLNGVRVAIQGLGHVGEHLAKILADLGAKLTLADPRTEHVTRIAHELDADLVGADSIFDTDCDVFAPCATGAVLNSGTIPRLRCAIVVGSANNQLADQHHAEQLAQRGILHAPDAIASAGGIISSEVLRLGGDQHACDLRVRGIAHHLRQVIHRAKSEGLTTTAAAEAMAKDRLDQARHIGPPLLRRTPYAHPSASTYR